MSTPPFRDDNAYGLTYEDLMTLKRLLIDYRNNPIGGVGNIRLQQPVQAPYQIPNQVTDFYVAQTPSGGIPAATVLSSQQIMPGTAVCQIFSFVPDPTLATPGTYNPIYDFNQFVDNISTSAISGNTWITVTKDKFGRWLAAVSEGGGATGPMGPAGPPIPFAGEDGEDGYSIPGPPGPQGVARVGLPGQPIPLAGEDGEDAYPIPGPAGVQGPLGLMGPLGPLGPKGDDGEDGYSIPGQQGIQGLLGQIGPPGAEADLEDQILIPGPMGPQGLQGIGVQGLSIPPMEPDLEDVLMIPGGTGANGTNGTNGTNGLTPYTYTSASFTIPAVGTSVTIYVYDNSWVPVNLVIFCGGMYGIVTSTGTVGTSNVIIVRCVYSTLVGSGVGSNSLVIPAGPQGPAGYYPQFFTSLIKNFIPSFTGAGTWTYYNDATAGIQLHGFSWYQSTGAANGDNAVIAFFLDAGTYTCYVVGYQLSDSGKLDWAVDGTTVTTGQDWYAATGVANYTLSFSFTISGAGRHLLKCTVNGKNASSTGYYINLTEVAIYPSTYSASHA